LGKEIKSEFKYTVNFINSPKGRVLSGDFQSKLTLELKGQGYSLLRQKISGTRTPLVVDLSKVIFKRIPDSKSISYYILSAGLISNFKKQMGNGLEVLSVKPDTIFMMFNVMEKVSDRQLK
jgi:hypothetical protein